MQKRTSRSKAGAFFVAASTVACETSVATIRVTWHIEAQLNFLRYCAIFMSSISCLQCNLSLLACMVPSFSDKKQSQPQQQQQTLTLRDFLMASISNRCGPVGAAAKRLWARGASYRGRRRSRGVQWSERVVTRSKCEREDQMDVEEEKGQEKRMDKRTPCRQAA